MLTMSILALPCPFGNASGKLDVMVSALPAAKPYVFVLGELRQHLEGKRDRLSRDVFEALLDAGTMRFIVVARQVRLPPASRDSAVLRLEAGDGMDGSLQHDLRERTAEDDLNDLEFKVATHLD